MLNPTYKILELLKENNISAHKLEVTCGLANGSVQAWKKGKANPSQKSLQKIAEYFNVSIDYLFFGTDKPSYEEKKKEAVSLIEELTPEEIKKLLEYKDFLISQRNKK